MKVAKLPTIDPMAQAIQTRRGKLSDMAMQQMSPGREMAMSAGSMLGGVAQPNPGLPAQFRGIGNMLGGTVEQPQQQSGRQAELARLMGSGGLFGAFSK